MVTFSAAEGLEITVTASGTITLPSYCNFQSADEYEVIALEGVGTVTHATKTATTFAAVTTGTTKFYLWTKIPGRCVRHVN